MVDEIDDLQVPGQDATNHLSGPALQGLRKNGVIGVGAAPCSDVPGLEKVMHSSIVI